MDFKEQHGKYIWFVDGDDWILENSVFKIMEIIINSPGIDIIVGDFVKVFEGKIAKKKELKDNIDFYTYDYPENLIKLFETNQLRFSLWCNIFKKSLFFDNNIFLEEGVKYTEDIDCTLKLFLKAKKINTLTKPIYAYRQNRAGAVTNLYTTKRVLDNMRLVKNWNEYLSKNTLKDKRLKEQLLNFIKYEYAIVVGILFLLSKEEKENLYSEIKEYEFLLKGGSGKKGILINCIYRIFGFHIVGILMGNWIKNKSKLRSKGWKN